MTAQIDDAAGTRTTQVKPSAASDILAALASLRPVATEHPLIRIGGFGDGGYLIPDDLRDITACFSPGVSRIATFELDLAKRGIPSFMADASVDGPPTNVPNAVFIKKYLGDRNDDTTIRLEDWVSEQAPAAGDLILQMDIEGGEYDTLAATSAATLKRFRILAIEFHSLHRLVDSGFLAQFASTMLRLLPHFAPVHLHPNNCCGSADLHGVETPRVLEATFLRRDRFREAGIVKTLPHPLDGRNVPKGEDLLLAPDFFGEGGRLASGHR